MNRPLLWFVASWIAGYIYADLWAALRPPIWLTIALAATTLACRAMKLRHSALLILPLLLLVSSGYYGWRDGCNMTSLSFSQDNPSVLSGSEAAVVGTIASEVRVDGDRASFTLAARELRLGGEPLIPLKEKLQVSVRLLSQPEQSIAFNWIRTQELKLYGTLLLPERARNFGGFDYREYLKRKHIHWLFTVKGAANVVSLPSEHRISLSFVLLMNDALRQTLSSRMDVLFPKDQSGLMKSMLIGWQNDLDPALYRQFSKLGITHILAISGMNIAIFLAMLFWVLKKLRVTKEKSLEIGIAATAAYVLLTGASPSIVRAGLMAMIALYAARRGLLKDGLHLTAAAAWIMLVWEPYYMHDIAFQLSFLITAALIAGVPRVARLLPLRSNRLKQALSIVLVSQLVSFPITITYFNGFSWLSWIANLLFVPVFGTVLFPGALITLMAGLLFEPAGRMIGWCVGALSRLTLAAIDWLSEWGGYQLVWPTPSVIWILLYFTVLIALYKAADRCVPKASHPQAAMGPSSGSELRLVTAASVGLLLLVVYAYTPDYFSRRAWVEFIDVGQGDAALIRTPARKFILVDGGGTVTYTQPGEQWKVRRDPYEVGRQVLVPLLKQRGVHELEYIISTHDDQDHVGGLQAVAEQIPVRQFLFNGTLKRNANVEALFQTLLQKNVPLISAQDAAIVRPDKETEMVVLNPSNAAQAKVRFADDQNNDSVVFLLQMQGYRWLFTGDMEEPSEEQLLLLLNGSYQSKRLTVDVLKVAHHGSNSSTSRGWLEYWQPRMAVISVGSRNVYGHPSPLVVQRLEAAGAVLYRTDLDGAVRITVNAQGLSVRKKLEDMH